MDDNPKRVYKEFRRERASVSQFWDKLCTKSLKMSNERSWCLKSFLHKKLTTMRMTPNFLEERTLVMKSKEKTSWGSIKYVVVSKTDWYIQFDHKLVDNKPKRVC